MPSKLSRAARPAAAPPCRKDPKAPRRPRSRNAEAGPYRKPVGFRSGPALELLEKIGPLGLCRKDLLSVHDVNGESAMRRAALYLRVSTLEQMTENQERELRAAAERMGCEIVAVNQ